MKLETAYAVCEAITRSEARNFSYGIRLLPTAKRQALSAIYAMARRIDDIGDGDLSDDQKLAGLDEVQRQLHPLDPTSQDPVVQALADTMERFPVPLEGFDEIVSGCRADVTVHRYGTFDDLVGYCRWVAGSVGRLSLGVYSPPRLEEAWGLADSLGVALQLTNILRDVREDRVNGRIYLPEEDLKRFECTLDVDERGRLVDPPAHLAALVRFEAERAVRWYDEGLRLLPLLDRRSAACTAAMAGIYRRLLDEIAADPERVRDTRVSLSTPDKLRVAARALARGTV
jgi:phytoene synthase